MKEKTRQRIQDISSEVDELHPLLQKLFEKHPKVSRVEYTHGPEEMGADFVLTRTHDVLGTTEYIGIVAKRGKIHQNTSDVERQIEECAVLRSIEGGKKQVVISEVWVVCTGIITHGAQRKINKDHPGTKVHFIDVGHLAAMVDEFVPYFLSDVELPVGTYLSDAKARSEELDRSLDLVQIEGESIYVNQDVVRVDVDPYRQEGRRRDGHRVKPVDIRKELKSNKLLLVEAGMGGGKSKLLRRLTQHYADVGVFVDEKVLPVYATFKELVDEYGGDLRRLLEAKVPDEVQKVVGDAMYLFLVDALDEKDLPPEELSDVLAGMMDLVDAEDGYRLVLTSRHVGSLDFDRRFLNRLERYEISQLSVGKIVHLLSVICKKLNLHTRIIEDLQRSPLFERLPRSPIAAVLLGQLLAQKRQELPSTMTELYSKYMEHALGRWDLEKGLQSQQEFEVLENVLMDLAAYMLENEIEIIGTGEVEGRFREYLRERYMDVEVHKLIERAVKRAEVLARSRDGGSLWFKHRSFAEFLYARWLLERGHLKADVKAFEPYWTNTYFFGLGLRKDAPDLLEALIEMPPETDGHRWMKVIALAEFFMAAYATPYRVIEEGVHRAALDAAVLFREAAGREVAAPFSKLTQMQLLYLIQLLVRDNYGYGFLAPALENAALKLADGKEDDEVRAYAIFLLSVAYIDAGRGQSFDWLLEDFKGYLPLDLSLAVCHEGDALEARNKGMKKLRKRVSAILQDDKARAQRDKMYERPIALLGRGKDNA